MELSPLAQFIAFAKIYSCLGCAIQEQLNQIIEGNFEGVNTNAIQTAKDRFRHSFEHPQLVEAFEAYDRYLNDEDDPEHPEDIDEEDEDETYDLEGMIYTVSDCVQFCKDMEEEGLEIEHYHGRNHWSGPAVRVPFVQDALSATRVKCLTDNMGMGMIVYPRRLDRGNAS